MQGWVQARSVSQTAGRQTWRHRQWLVPGHGQQVRFDSDGPGVLLKDFKQGSDAIQLVV